MVANVTAAIATGVMHCNRWNLECKNGERIELHTFSFGWFGVLMLARSIRGMRMVMTMTPSASLLKCNHFLDCKYFTLIGINTRFLNLNVLWVKKTKTIKYCVSGITLKPKSLWMCQNYSARTTRNVCATLLACNLHRLLRLLVNLINWCWATGTGTGTRVSLHTRIPAMLFKFHITRMASLLHPPPTHTYVVTYENIHSHRPNTPFCAQTQDDIHYFISPRA